MKKQVTIFFDLEGWWESQARRRFNLEKNIQKILKILDKHKISAVFNTCGIVIENFPELIRQIHRKNHEIASHGYAHENFTQLTYRQMNSVLSKTEKLLENTIGKKPAGMRSPWLLYNNQVYKVLEKRGYRWASNYALVRTEVLRNPRSSSSIKRAANILAFGLLWKTFKQRPHMIGDLLEIPLISSQDGALLDSVDPEQKSPKERLDFAYESLKTQFDKSGDFFNLNFHPWLIGSANRPILLKRILSYIANHEEIEFVLPIDLLKKMVD